MNANKSLFTRDIDRYKADSETIQAKLCSDATDNELNHSHAKPYPWSWQIPRLSWAYPKWIFYDTILEQVDHSHTKTLSLIITDC